MTKKIECASVHCNQDASNRFLICINSFFQDDATGQAYAVTRAGESGDLEMEPLSGSVLEGISLDVEGNPAALHQYNMIIIDSGNTHGDAWKAIYHPQQQVLHFLTEQ